MRNDLGQPQLGTLCNYVYSFFSSILNFPSNPTEISMISSLKSLFLPIPGAPPRSSAMPSLPLPGRCHVWQSAGCHDFTTLCRTIYLLDIYMYIFFYTYITYIHYVCVIHIYIYCMCTNIYILSMNVYYGIEESTKSLPSHLESRQQPRNQEILGESTN